MIHFVFPLRSGATEKITVVKQDGNDLICSFRFGYGQNDIVRFTDVRIADAVPASMELFHEILRVAGSVLIGNLQNRLIRYQYDTGVPVGDCKTLVYVHQTRSLLENDEWIQVQEMVAKRRAAAKEAARIAAQRKKERRAKQKELREKAWEELKKRYSSPVVITEPSTRTLAAMPLTPSKQICQSREEYRRDRSYSGGRIWTKPDPTYTSSFQYHGPGFWD